MEEKRPGEYFPVFENDKGTFIFNSKDLCMIEHIKELDAAGVKSLKIEGRVKSEYYVSTVVKAYRQAIDDYYAGKEFNEKLKDEVLKVSHREYSKGFYFGNPEQIYTYGSYVRNYDIVGVVLSYDEETKMATIEQRNRFFKGDSVEFMPPKGDFISCKVEKIVTEEGEEVDSAPHPQQILKIPVNTPLEKDTIMRKEL
jgi:putative protease